jgi:hypothetical protein
MKRKKPVYYTAFGLKDGTVFAAMPVRKPHKAKPDPEGVCTFIPYNEVVPADLPDWHRTAFFAAVSTDINVRRIVRERVVPRLDALEKEVAEARKQLARIEQKLDLLLQQDGNAGG